MGTGLIFNMTGGGGGTSLNFEVKTYATEDDLPESAKENTVAVISSISVPSWSFASSEPTNPEEGMMWFRTGSNPAITFNALKKNCVMVYAEVAKQYADGSWADVPVKSYIDEEWVDWWIPGTLFANGMDGTDLTGGWQSYGYVAGSGYTGVTETIDITSDGLSVTFDDTSGANRSTFIGTTNKIDLGDYSTLTMEFSEATTSVSGGGAVKVCLYSDEGYTQAAEAEVLSGTTGTFTNHIELDVSGLDRSATYYIGFMMWKWNNASIVVTATMTMARLS